MKTLAEPVILLFPWAMFAEAQQAGLDWYDFAARSYDPQIGRWMQPDPMMQHASPYLAMSDNPASFTDPFGLSDGGPINGGSLPRTVVEDKWPWWLERKDPAASDMEKMTGLANKAVGGGGGGSPQTEWEKRNWNRYNDPQNGQSHKSFDPNTVWNAGETQGMFKAAVPFALGLVAVDGPIPIGDMVAGGVLAAAGAYDLSQRKFITYTLKNPVTGQIYAGRASGYGSPQSIMMNRFSGHHMKAQGFANPQLDRVAQGYPVGYYAIRGREQDIIDGNGGIGSPTLGNTINGISIFNPSRPLYQATSNFMFGPYIK